MARPNRAEVAFAAASLALFAALPAAAEPAVRTISTPGQMLWGGTPLTSDSFLAFRFPVAWQQDEVLYPEGACVGSLPLELVLVREPDGADPEITPIPVPYELVGLPRDILRLSPTRAL